MAAMQNESKNANVRCLHELPLSMCHVDGASIGWKSQTKNTVLRCVLFTLDTVFEFAPLYHPVHNDTASTQVVLHTCSFRYVIIRI